MCWSYRKNITSTSRPSPTPVPRPSGGLLEEMARLAHQVAVSEGIERSGYRAVFNNGPDSGQEVLHVHAHVLGGRTVGMAAW